MAAPTPSQIAYGLKKFYHGQRLENLILHERKLMDMLQKDTNFGGDDEPFPVYTSPGVNVSGDFTVANTSPSGGSGVKFRLTNGKLYGIVPLDDESLMRGRKDAHTFMDHKKEEMGGVIEYMADQLAGQVFGSGGGALGTVGTITTGSDIFTLSDGADVNLIEIGSSLVFSDDDGSSASHSLKTATLTVTGINRNTNTISYTVASGADTNVADGDYIFLEGTFGGASAANNAIPMKGLGSWHPLTVASSGDSHFGIDRYGNDRLTGTVWNPSTGSGLIRIRQAANEANTKFRAKPKLGVVSPTQHLNMAIELENAGPNRDFTVKNERGNTGYKALSITTAYGEVGVIGDAFCGATDGWLLNTKYIWLKSMGQLVHVMDRDGQKMLRDTSTPTYSIRLVSYPQLAISRPMENARVVMPTLS